MKLKLRVVVAIASMFVCSSPAFSVVSDPYWQIDETLVEDYYTDVDQVGLTITNMHGTLAMDGFALTVADNCVEVQYPFDGWAGEHNSGSGAWGSTFDALSGETLEEYFGMSFTEAFPGADPNNTHWVFFVGDQRDTPPGSIAAGETVGLNSDVPPNYLFYYLTTDAPWSDAIVRLTNGQSYIGPTDQPNPFTGGDVIPEPAALCLLALGGGVGLFRRKRSA